ncbi:MAG: hypothetical protein RR902_00845 [Oscillospiraceae bacterium]
MDLNTNISQLQECGLTAKQMSNGIIVHGVYRDFAVLSTLSGKGDKIFLTHKFTLLTPASGKYLKPLKDVLGKGTTFTTTYNILDIECRIGTAENDVTVKQTLDIIIDLLVENGKHTQVCCPICKLDGCDAAAFYDGMYTAVHTDCIKNEVNKKAKTAHKQANGNVFLGLLGAIIGAFIGTLPTIFSIVKMDYLIALLCAVIPMASFFGYKLFHGKVNKATVWIIAAISLLQSFTIMVISIMMATGTPFFTSLLILIAYFGDFAGIFAQIIVFIGLGILFAWGYIRRKPQDIMQNAELMRDTAIYHNFGGSGSSPYKTVETSNATASVSAQESLPTEMQDN